MGSRDFCIDVIEYFGTYGHSELEYKTINYKSVTVPYNNCISDILKSIGVEANAIDEVRINGTRYCYGEPRWRGHIGYGDGLGDGLNYTEIAIIDSNDVLSFRRKNINTDFTNNNMENTQMYTENIVVSAGRLPGHVREYEIPTGSNIKYILGLIDPTLSFAVSSGIMSVRKNAVSAGLYDLVDNGDIVQVAKNVQGNSNEFGDVAGYLSGVSYSEVIGEMIDNQGLRLTIEDFKEAVKERVESEDLLNVYTKVLDILTYVGTLVPEDIEESGLMMD